MINLLRKPLLVSSTALLSLTVLPAVVSTLALPLASSVVSVAHADDDNGGGGGNDDNGGGGNDDNGGGNDDNGNDDHGNDDGPGADDDGSDDDANGMDDDAKGLDDTTDDIDDDINDDNAANGRADETQLVVNDAQFAGLKNGSLMAVDQAGQRLQLRFEWEYGKPEVKFQAPANTVTAVTVVPAN